MPLFVYILSKVNSHIGFVSLFFHISDFVALHWAFSVSVLILSVKSFLGGCCARALYYKSINTESQSLLTGVCAQWRDQVLGAGVKNGNNKSSAHAFSLVQQEAAIFCSISVCHWLQTPFQNKRGGTLQRLLKVQGNYILLFYCTIVFLKVPQEQETYQHGNHLLWLELPQLLLFITYC